MNVEVVKLFLNQEKLKLVKNDGYTLYGKILRIEHDSVIVQNTKKDSISAVSLDCIAEITPIRPSEG